LPAALTPAPVVVPPPIQQSTPRPPAASFPTASPAVTTMGAAASTATATPIPNLNVFTYGSVPQNNFAQPTDPVQIFYATFGPTVLTHNGVVTLNVVTTTNAQQVTLTYGTFRQSLAQVNPGQWQARFQISPMVLPAPPSNVSLTLSAARTYGSSQSIVIPVSISQ
jgi:hypothetical protein